MKGKGEQTTSIFTSHVTLSAAKSLSDCVHVITNLRPFRCAQGAKLQLCTGDL